MPILKPYRLLTAVVLAFLVATPVFAAPTNEQIEAQSADNTPQTIANSYKFTSVDPTRDNALSLALFAEEDHTTALLTEDHIITAGEELTVEFAKAQCPSLSCYLYLSSDAPVEVQRTVILKAGEKPRDFPTVFLDNSTFTPISGDVFASAARANSENDKGMTAAGIQAPTAAYSITIRAGGTVSWVRDNGIHSVTADGGTFDSGEPSDEWVLFSNTFNTVGQFPYHCKLHGAAGGLGMAGIINVIAAGDPGPGSKLRLLLPMTAK